MTKIARKTQKIFASSATNNGQFGSAQTGAKVTSNDLATLQSLGAFLTGWVDAVIGTKKFPPLEEFQALDYINTYQLSYIFQEGISEYDAGTTYFQNSIVKKAGTYQIYGSITDTNVGNALTDATKWQFLVDFAAAPTASSYLNYAADTGTTNHIVIAPSPVIGAYAAGQVVTLKPAHDVTGACDIAVNGLAAKSIKLIDGSNPVAGMINATGVYIAIYNGTAFVVLNPNLGTAAFYNVGTTSGTIPVLTTGGKYPAQDGSLITNIGAIKRVTTKAIYASGTYTADANLAYATVEIVGGGGKGIGQSTGFYPGGGAGEYARGTFSASTIGVGQTVVIGAGGTDTANPGGTTSFGALMTAIGGQPGAFNMANSFGGTGGSGGDFRAPGQDGAPGQAGHGALMAFGSGSSLGPGALSVPNARIGVCLITEYCYA